MSRKLSELPPSVRKGGFGPRPEQYPYDEWLDGDVTLVVEGEDYEAGNTKKVRNNTINASKKRGLKIVTRAHDEGFVVQALLAEVAA